ncbi:hypothetical protein V8B55DRAFT_1587487 [Mucor lusitanicus]|uniref:F-box domain-containing protein n=2 Tax=Mucor circinelloides f. lusitanicus TaxID=29924 RepID=A0A162RS56_MUCCL|nr:hypothetical protein FB192DRAFT_1435096 [Mucor lusitanicus]OAD08349.1 hypothetical protein MUCCIDRAFT_105313 [Mucor lusitanicus CBS 277.49]
MKLQHLPFELQLLILDYIQQDNHLDLAPISHACKLFSCAVADRLIRAQSMTLLQTPTYQHNASLGFLRFAARQNNNHFITNNLQASIADRSGLFIVSDILANQQRANTMNTIHLLVPYELQPELLGRLSKHPQTQLEKLSIRDAADDNQIMTKSYNNAQIGTLEIAQAFTLGFLSASHKTLTKIDLPSFPSSLLLTTSEVEFPKVSYLHVALMGHNSQQYNQLWRNFKAKFPALRELRLTLDREHLALFKSLLEDTSLFPWIKRLTIQSNECPKTFLSQQELRNSLLQLNGLNRITAGWDMIALN